MNPRTKRALKRAAALVPQPVKRVLEATLQVNALLAARWADVSHLGLRAVQWGLPPLPEHFDHTIDLYAEWRRTRNPLWLERGVLSGLALRGGDVLELACGDGFNARNFYSLRSRRVVACDFDPSAIATARRKNSAPNVEYVLADIRTAMPKGRFANVVWDAAIEHFTPAEIDAILAQITTRLTGDGILSGYTIARNASGQKQLAHHEYEFADKDDLLRFFTLHFRNVTVFETIYPGRHNLYFYASDGVVPFGDGWANAVSATAPSARIY